MSTPDPKDVLRKYNEGLSHVLPKAVGTNLVLWSSVSVRATFLTFHRRNAHPDTLSSVLFSSSTFCDHETRYLGFVSPRCRCGGTRRLGKHREAHTSLCHRPVVATIYANYHSAGRLRTEIKVPCRGQEAALGTHSFAVPSPAPPQSLAA